MTYKSQRVAQLHSQTDHIQSEIQQLKRDPGVEVDETIHVYMDAHPGVVYADAMTVVLNDPANADLAKRYSASFGADKGPLPTRTSKNER